MIGGVRRPLFFTRKPLSQPRALHNGSSHCHRHCRRHRSCRVPLPQGPAAITALAYSPQGDRIAAGGEDGSVTLYETDGGWVEGTPGWAGPW